MILPILIAFFSLMGLLVLHEFGHFWVAKRFGVKVEEFGIGYPPRIFGKKIGDTVYSINLLPFGAFVKMPGEIEHTDDPQSFFKKPVWQRALIVAAGVLSFWIVSSILFGIVMGLGTPTAISDEETAGALNPKVQIAAITKDSPAESAGIKIGDSILEIKVPGSEFVQIDTAKKVQGIIDLNKGKEILLKIERGKEVLMISVAARLDPPTGEGPLGIVLIRTAIKSYPWWQVGFRGVLSTINLTEAVILGYFQAIANIFKGAPSGVELIGPVGIVSLFGQFSKLGVNYFLQFIGMIAVYVAVFNILPIPSVDGGKLLFLGIEAVRKKPVSQKAEQGITTIFFSMLILLMIFVTVKDVIRLF